MRAPTPARAAGGARGAAAPLPHPQQPRLPLLSSTLEWRAKYRPDAISWGDVKRLNTGRLELLDERDAGGRPINYFRLR